MTDKDNNLIGIVTGRDLRFEKRLNLPIRNVMTGKDDLVTVKEGASSDVVLDLCTNTALKNLCRRRRV